ncbi:MAG: hypothetical protein LAP40_00425 [Acidobacteriia bacterium]|nr:hypothetical protein [Terriglobia bacterium]
MSSFLQIQANRRNSQNSTGPRTPEGKAASRFNALQSGIDAKALVIPGEAAEDLEALAANYRLLFEPASPLEIFLVDQLVYADWQLRRLHKIEANLRAQAAHSPHDALDLALNRIARLERRIDATERSYFRALKQLERFQTPAKPSVPAPGPQPLVPAPASGPHPPAPAADHRPPAAAPAPELASFPTSPPPASPPAEIPPRQTIMS